MSKLSTQQKQEIIDKIYAKYRVYGFHPSTPEEVSSYKAKGIKPYLVYTNIKNDAYMDDNETALVWAEDVDQARYWALVTMPSLVRGNIVNIERFGKE